MSIEFQARTIAKFPSICPRCFQRIRVGESIVQEENGAWSHSKICDGKKKAVEIDAHCERKTLEF
jgi:hypothetical protein